jgi:hypothetical protein
MFRILCFILLGSSLALGQGRRSLLDSDPDVVYLDQHLAEPIELGIVKAAPIFSDKEGQRRLGAVTPGQRVVLEAMTERAYRVTAKTGGNRVKGWVAPWAFEAKQPDFVEVLKKFYQRQLQVMKLIEEERAAIGMTMSEVGRALGEPTKKTLRKTPKGQTGSWEFIVYDEVRHYRFIQDPVSGQLLRQLSHITQEEKGKTVVEFEDDLVTAIEETENRGQAAVRVVVPPIVFGW